jgi:ABC-type transport system involved in multi-copper enzyme maturation permease subunit
MSTFPTTPDQPTPMPAQARTDTVVMGRQDFASVLLRLIGVELYKFRRRVMSKVLGIVGLSLMIFIFLIISLGTLFVASSSTSSYVPQQCSAVRNPQGPQNPTGQPCIDHPPTQQELAQAQQTRQDQLKAVSTPLRLPFSLYVAEQVMQVIGLVLVIIIAGTIVGGEYSVGTIRLMSTRGPTRLQYLLSKMGALLVCIVIGYVFLVLVGLALGALLNLVSGVATNTDFLNNGGLGHIFLFALVGMFSLFVYSMLALFLSTLGRATAAGVAGTLVWWVLENVLNGALSLVALLVKGPLGDFLKAIPDYFIGTNIGALLGNQEQYFLGFGAGSLSDVHAILVLLVYLALFLGLSILVTIRRDITN